MADSADSNTTNQSTVAAFAILERMVEEGEPCRVTDLATALGMPRARIYRYLQTLLSLGYVRQDPATERYWLTLKLFHLGQAIADRTQLTLVSRPIMAALRDKVAQTVTLSIPDPDGMRVIDIVRIKSPVQIVTQPGAVLDLYMSAQGKIAMAFGDPSYREGMQARIDRGAPELGDRDSAWLKREVENARKRGWSVAPEEALRGVNAISAPIFDAERRFAATVTVVGSVHDIEPEPAEFYIDAVTTAAREISQELGCLEYPL